MPAAPVIIFFAGDPVAKGRPRFASLGNGRPVAFTPAKTRKYEAALRYAAQQAMNGRALLTGPLSMTVTATMPVPQSWSGKKQRAALAGEIMPTKRPDADNFGKLAADSLNTVVFADDSQIVDWRVIKLYGERPGLRIEVASVRAGGEAS